MRISGINNTYTDYGKFASGKRIQTAADDAAGLAISQKMQAQKNTYDVGSENIKHGIGLSNIKDGALGGINDYLGRIHELSIRSMNGLMSDSDKSAIQAEIDQMKQGIEQLAENTQFNEINVLNGTSSDINIETGSGGLSLKESNSTLKALGIENYNIMGDFDLSSIEKTMEKVNSMRSKTGAETNALESAYNYATNTSLNTTAAKSRIEDLDYPKAISEVKKQHALQQYAFAMQRKQMESQANILNLFI